MSPEALAGQTELSGAFAHFCDIFGVEDDALPDRELYIEGPLDNHTHVSADIGPTELPGVYGAGVTTYWKDAENTIITTETLGLSRLTDGFVRVMYLPPRPIDEPWEAVVRPATEQIEEAEQAMRDSVLGNISFTDPNFDPIEIGVQIIMNGELQASNAARMRDAVYGGIQYQVLVKTLRANLRRVVAIAS